jgi:hypothetical protein
MTSTRRKKKIAAAAVERQRKHTMNLAAKQLKQGIGKQMKCMEMENK